MKDKLTVVGIACNDSELALRKAIKDFDVKWTNYFEDDKLSSQYGVTGYPAKFLISPEGKIVFRYDGEHEDFYKEILNYIK